MINSTHALTVRRLGLHLNASSPRQGVHLADQGLVEKWSANERQNY